MDKSRQYHLKDKKIYVYKAINSVRSVLEDKEYVPLVLWAYTRQLSQDQIYQARAYGESENRLFVLNYNKRISVGDFIKYKDHYYTITRVDSMDDYNTELFVYVKDAPDGDERSLRSCFG